MEYNERTYGFQWGAAIIERLFSDSKRETVTLSLQTLKENLQIYVTKTGKVRIFSQGREWIKPAKRETK